MERHVFLAVLCTEGAFDGVSCHLSFALELKIKA